MCLIWKTEAFLVWLFLNLEWNEIFEMLNTRHIQSIRGVDESDSIAK